MTSTIHADKIMNSSGDQVSGVDLLVNDQVKIKTANTYRVIIDSSGRVGIGTTSPSDPLHVKGFAQIEGNAGDASYLRINNTANSGGKIWRTGAGLSAHGTFSIYNQTDNKFGINVNSNGYVNKPNQPAFKTALVTTAQAISNQTWTKINLNHSYFNIVSHYNITASGTNPYAFTAPIAGIYFFSWTMNLGTALYPGGYYYTALYKNGSVADGQSYINGLRTSGSGIYIESDTQLTGACLLQLAVNDKIEPYAYGHFNGNPSTGNIQAGGRTFMTGCLIA